MANTGGNVNPIDAHCRQLALTILNKIPIMPTTSPNIPSSPWFIHRIPEKLRVADDEPRIVSIGPFHRNKEKLYVTETHKISYLSSFLSMASKANPSSRDKAMASMVKKMKEVEIDARQCYAETFSGILSDDFVQMMILDGCFILELLYKFQKRHQLVADKLTDDLAQDILFNKNWIMHSLRRDLVLLENQIPLLVLQSLFELSGNNALTLNELVELFFNPILPTIPEAKIASTIRGHHILDLLRNHLLHGSREQSTFGNEPIWVHTTCATVLRDAGIHFKKKSKYKSLLDITFNSGNGKFEMPPFYFGESWTVLLRNMIALEQCREDYPDKITSYVILVDNLVNSDSDVKLFRDKGIIYGSSVEDENIANAINTMCKEAVVDEFYYDRLCCEVNGYRKKNWHKWIPTLKRDYCSSPWAKASVAAGVLLLVLTLLQTLFTMFNWKIKT